jgi:hypothetical protein
VAIVLAIGRGVGRPGVGTDLRGRVVAPIPALDLVPTIALVTVTVLMNDHRLVVDDRGLPFDDPLLWTSVTTGDANERDRRQRQRAGGQEGVHGADLPA